MYIKKGDKVVIISGAERGKTGTVHRVFRREGQVVIEGVNLKKKHSRARRSGQKGQMIEVAMPIAVSNIALVEDGRPVRVGRKLVGERWVRVSKKSGKEI